MFAQNKPYQPARPTNLGLVAELAYIKGSSEGVLVHLFDGKRKDKISKQDSLNIISSYNEVYLLVNPLILQLEADITLHPCMHGYKKLDKLLKKHAIDYFSTKDSVSIKNKPIEPYIEVLKKASKASLKIADQALKFSQDNDEKSPTKSWSDVLTPISTIGGIVSTGVGTFKTIQDTRGAKVSSIYKIVDALKLSAPSELLSNTAKTDSSKTATSGTAKP